MRIVFAFMLLVGVGLAGAAAYMVMQRFNQLDAELAQAKRNALPPIDLTQVAVAADDLEYGILLREENIRMVDWPTDAIPEGAFTTIESLLDSPTGQPRTIMRIMSKDEVILPRKVSDFGEGGGIRTELSPGMRAFTIRVDVSTGVSGFLQPGDRVDVYWTGNAGRETITKLILQNALLIAIDQISDVDSLLPTIARTVTLEISPQIVGELTQAQQTGRLTLSLRGITDIEETGPIEVDTRDITGEPEIIEEVEEPKCYNRERKGTELIITEVPCTD